MNINTRLADAPLVPLLQAQEPVVAVNISRALLDGGLQVQELVLRTARALECVRAIADELPDVIIGAGTVLDVQQAERACDSGAQFIVSPGLDENIVAFARERSLPIYPGTMTAGEVQRAHNLGLDVVKFFPAALAGGVPMLTALSSVFRNMKFMPTGGINADNLADYLALPSVIACGGSWLTPEQAIAAGDFAAISKLASEALAVIPAQKPVPA